MQSTTRDSDAAPSTTICAKGHATDRMTSVTITGRVVYLRCRHCRIFWSIPERRASFRMQDAHKVFDV